MSDLVALIEKDVALVKVAGTDGGEWVGACPWCGGDDRFHVWPKPRNGRARWWCRGCDRHGDGIAYLRERYGMSFGQACAELGLPAQSAKVAAPGTAGLMACPAPSAAWQQRAHWFVSECRDRLWSADGTRALQWLVADRRLTPEVIRCAGLGWNNVDKNDRREAWGLPPETDRHGKVKSVFLPAGWVIPWRVGGELWRANVRRMAGEPKYIGPAGFGVGLYGADAIAPGRPAVLVEGELDALTVEQCAGDLVAAVATGSTDGARRPKWLARLALASEVLVAFDADQAGDDGAAYWTRVLPNARRWRPPWGDVNGLLQAGMDVRGWLEAGLPGKAKPTTAAHRCIACDGPAKWPAMVCDGCRETAIEAERVA